MRKLKKYGKYLIILFCLISIIISTFFIPISASKLIPKLEKQVYSELGVNIHIEKLILRLGPSIKLKTPIMHVMYEDGQKFAQFNNVKFYIPWSSLFKKKPSIKSVYSKKVNVRINSDDKFLPMLINRLKNRDIASMPNILFDEYSFTYTSRLNGDKYKVEGKSAEIKKAGNYENVKLKTTGVFKINDKNHITYDLKFIPKYDIEKNDFEFDICKFIEQIKELDFQADLIADMQIYKNKGKAYQASGLINIDNISVLDKQKKDNKSFVYLTFWGDKASILSNIYTNNNKKVYLEGMLNNSNKPVLDLKVRTDEIELADLHKKVKLLTCFSFLKDIDIAKGKLNANFTLKGDLSKIKSNGYMNISDAEIQSNGIRFNKIASNIDFSNNSININNAVGYINNSPVLLKGKIDESIDIELLMNKVDLKSLLPSNLGIKNGTLSAVANISGKLGNLLHKENIQIENFSLEKDGQILNLDSLKYDTNKDEVAYISNLNYMSDYLDTVKIPSMKLQVNNDNIKLPPTNVFMANSKVSIKGDVNNYLNDSLTFNTGLEGFVNTKDIKKLSETSTIYPVKININGNKNIQNLFSQIQIENAKIFDEPVSVNLNSKLDKNNLRIEDLSITPISLKASDEPIQNSRTNKKVFVSGFIDDLDNPKFKNLRIFIPQQLNLHLFDTLLQLKGDIFLNGKISSPEIIGQLSVQNLFNKDLELSLTNSTVDFNKSTYTINAPIVKLNDTTLALNATGLTDLSKGVVLNNASVKSKYINTDTLLMYKDFSAFNDFNLDIKNGKIYAERLSTSLYGNQLYQTAFSSDFSLNDNVLKLENIDSELLNGKIAGNLDYNLRDEHFNANIMARNVSASPVFDIISTRKDSISGVMDFDISLSGELMSKRSLNGDIKFIVNNGKMSTLGKLEHLLYAQNVIADNMLRTSLSVVTKAITLKNTGLFKYLRGEISMKDGIAHIKSIQSLGPLMALYMKGEYNPDNDYAKLLVLGRLSDEIISGLGAFGEFSFNKLMIMLTGEEKNVVVLPEEYNLIPQLPMKNTKEFRSIINGIIDKPSSVILFNWISYSEKSLRQKDVPMTDTKLPDFVEQLPY
ncbi:MAG: hypothetical protein E7Z89_00935 [Cyanobacteria bacterium SIG28]|nr:hypothetical protein [Cyanobacteria bacterium SIG28]